MGAARSGQDARTVPRNYGLDVVVIEDTAPMDEVRLGGPGRDEQIDWFCTQLRAMGELGITTLCYNWVAVTNWARTTRSVPLRGGAVSTGYDDEIMRRAPPLIEPGSMTHQQLWDAYEYFLRAVVPVAEEAGVRIALHPDDPPLTEVGVPPDHGLARGLREGAVDGRQRVLGDYVLPGNFSLMTDDVPALIRQLGRDKRIFFAHFRDVVGDAHNFVEVFHDEGPTDMLECMRAYHDIGFDGALRPDHVPAMEGESNETFGYAVLGRLFAIGYMTGLREAANQYN